MTETNDLQDTSPHSNEVKSSRAAPHQEHLINDLPHFEPIADAFHERVLARAREVAPALAERRRLRQEAEEKLYASGELNDPEDLTFD